MLLFVVSLCHEVSRSRQCVGLMIELVDKLIGGMP